MTSFEQIISEYPGSLEAGRIRTMQVNVGSKCNKTCTHCHLSASPTRNEQMDWPVMEQIIAVVRGNALDLIDITGGAPELNPHLKPLISALAAHVPGIQVRTNLTALLEPPLADLPAFFAHHRVALVASLPCYLEQNVDAMRGAGTHTQCMDALRILNALGYASDPRLPLHLVYNPAGPFLPPPQQDLERDYRTRLTDAHGVSFTRLLTITNVPLGRFGESLDTAGQHSDYMALLQRSFNPDTLPGLMCRSQVSVRWDGVLFDCDFNLALNMPVNNGARRLIHEFDMEELSRRTIVTGDHCYACTAGAGSSCSGAIV